VFQQFHALFELCKILCSHFITECLGACLDALLKYFNAIL